MTLVCVARSSRDEGRLNRDAARPVNALSGSDATGRPEATRPWRSDFMKRSGMRIAGARSGPPLKPASQSWYFHCVRLSAPMAGAEAADAAVLAWRAGLTFQYICIASSQRPVRASSKARG